MNIGNFSWCFATTRTSSCHDCSSLVIAPFSLVARDSARSQESFSGVRFRRLRLMSSNWGRRNHSSLERKVWDSPRRWKMIVDRGPTKSLRLDVTVIKGRVGFLTGWLTEGSFPILVAIACFSSSPTLPEKRARGISSSETYQVCRRRISTVFWVIFLLSAPGTPS